ncbi:hypothetical protein P152DRAFT_290021 [Eremomyces bilateralis CBS 781.70]|uniref:Uncharacterized protein n=1 Tax=Eremomyces bilateralis CBS 781.70 TaxID=1392243 RepID=A0A6G1G7C3_9PEZI|nr:uncharacterized protein P152DRAFT_290021 [Eremomyces bilateralis CBS 781.70]KAF1813739.1 hypothetical protein P152DRAFT_290021 [Eremomyces bilateralis CBS 781.70]
MTGSMMWLGIHIFRPLLLLARCFAIDSRLLPVSSIFEVLESIIDRFEICDACFCSIEHRWLCWARSASTATRLAPVPYESLSINRLHSRCRRILTSCLIFNNFIFLGLINQRKALILDGPEAYSPVSKTLNRCFPALVVFRSLRDGNIPLDPFNEMIPKLCDSMQEGWRIKVKDCPFLLL